MSDLKTDIQRVRLGFARSFEDVNSLRRLYCYGASLGARVLGSFKRPVVIEVF